MGVQGLESTKVILIGPWGNPCEIYMIVGVLMGSTRRLYYVQLIEMLYSFINSLIN